MISALLSHGVQRTHGYTAAIEADGQKTLLSNIALYRIADHPIRLDAAQKPWPPGIRLHCDRRARLPEARSVESETSILIRLVLSLQRLLLRGRSFRCRGVRHISRGHVALITFNRATRRTTYRILAICGKEFPGRRSPSEDSATCARYGSPALPV